MKKSLRFLAGLTTFIAITQIAFAATNGDFAISNNDVTFSTDNFLEGKITRIYATVHNNSHQDLLGVVRFFDNGNQIGGDQPLSIFATKTDGVFVDWNPNYGDQSIVVKIFPWQAKIDDPSNNSVTINVHVLQDTDHDGIPNATDPDIDGDGVPNAQDAFPLDPKEWKDTDGDGIGDNSDPDIDNDGVPNQFDDLPYDANETIDTDHDGIGNIADTDDDNDGIPDIQEEKMGTNPLKADTDGDGVPDGIDAFPLDPKEWKDTDHDGIGDNADTDIDNDGIPNNQDPFPTNVAPVIKLKNNPSIADLLNPNFFDASPSYDKDGKIVSYKWEINNQEIKGGNTINEVFDKPGKNTIKLTVTDNSGESTSKEFEVSVLNIALYKELGITLIIILLALGIYFKYIAEAKNNK